MSDQPITDVVRTTSQASDFQSIEPTGEGMLQVAQTRAAQEVQAAMIIAQRFPRDEQRAYTKILTACKRPGLAQKAAYVYPKGGQSITGPSIRLAEVLARSWGNIDCGIVELEQKDGESIVMSYAWDLETNFKASKIFTVPHLRHTKKGDYKVDDPREIYEMVANVGSRRLRACILAVIPGDVVEEALAACDATVAGSNTEPLVDRLRKMVAAFGELGVTQDMIEEKLGHKLPATTETELGTLRKIYTSIRDGFAPREAFFDPNAEVSMNEQPGKRMSLRGKTTPPKQASPETTGPGQAKEAERAAKASTPATEPDKKLPASSDTPTKGPGASSPDASAPVGGIRKCHNCGFIVPVSAKCCPECGVKYAGGAASDASRGQLETSTAPQPQSVQGQAGAESGPSGKAAETSSAPPAVDVEYMRETLRRSARSNNTDLKVAALEAREVAGIELIDDASPEQVTTAYGLYEAALKKAK